MKRFVALCGLLATYAACQKPGDEEDICDQAQVHLEECKLADDEPPSECTEREECTAACIVDASCDELDSPDPDGSYIECLADCQRKAPGENSSCEDALAQLRRCGVDTSGVDPERCSAEDACIAICVNDASCTDITVENPESAYRECLLDCQN
ncbi:MAG TPA: hypothetical protein VGK73_21875 [Polyangiaceae bacterium]